MGVVVAFAIDGWRKCQYITRARGNTHLAAFATLGVNNDCSLDFRHLLVEFDVNILN